MDELINRLSRYSEKAIADALDEDFAKAVIEAHFAIVNMNGYIEQQKSVLKDCRNELCFRCGDYRMRHKGACDGCRWKDGG